MLKSFRQKEYNVRWKSAKEGRAMKIVNMGVNITHVYLNLIK